MCMKPNCCDNFSYQNSTTENFETKKLEKKLGRRKHLNRDCVDLFCAHCWLSSSKWDIHYNVCGTTKLSRIVGGSNWHFFSSRQSSFELTMNNKCALIKTYIQFSTDWCVHTWGRWIVESEYFQASIYRRMLAMSGENCVQLEKSLIKFVWTTILNLEILLKILMIRRIQCKMNFNPRKKKRREIWRFHPTLVWSLNIKKWRKKMNGIFSLSRRFFFGLHRDLLRCCATKTSSKRGGEWLHHKFINILYLCCASILNFKVMRSGDNQHRICIISHNGIEKDFFFTTFSTTIQHQFSFSGRFVTACRQWKTFVVTETAHVSQQNHNEGHFSTKKTEKNEPTKVN